MVVQTGVAWKETGGRSWGESWGGWLPGYLCWAIFHPQYHSSHFSWEALAPPNSRSLGKGKYPILWDTAHPTLRNPLCPTVHLNPCWGGSSLRKCWAGSGAGTFPPHSWEPGWCFPLTEELIETPGFWHTGSACLTGALPHKGQRNSLLTQSPSSLKSESLLTHLWVPCC